MPTHTARFLYQLAGLTPPGMDQLMPAPGISELEIENLCQRMDAARIKARMTANEFLALESAASKDFCVRFGLSRTEVRLAQTLVAVTRAIRRSHKVGARLVRQRLQRAHTH
jgi:hypothetical protein